MEADNLNRILQNFSRDLHVSLPVQVQSFTPGTATEPARVTVQPALVRSVPQGEDLPPVVEPLPTIPDVPVQYARGGGYFFTFPLAPGDTGMVVFSDLDLGQWIQSGGTSVNPGDQRAHTLSGAWFVPGVDTVQNAIQGFSGSALRIGYEGGATLELSATQLKVAGTPGALPAAVGVALSNLVTAQLNALKGAISGAAVLAGDGGATFKANIIAALTVPLWPGNVASSTLLSE